MSGQDFRTSLEKADEIVACVASVSVRFSARSRHFLFLSRAKIGASAKKCVTGEPAPIFPRPKSEKCIERAESLTETLATQANEIEQIQTEVVGYWAIYCSCILTLGSRMYKQITPQTWYKGGGGG